MCVERRVSKVPRILSKREVRGPFGRPPRKRLRRRLPSGLLLPRLFSPLRPLLVVWEEDENEEEEEELVMTKGIPKGS